jgi:murein DD-endopeptidase MepM/ murein hydrolase activator NlpD
VVGRIAPDGSWGGYGNVVVLYHHDGTSSLYAHQKEFRAGLRVGQWLQQGEHLGYLGNTESGQRGPRATSGTAMTPHVHFEALVGHPRSVRGFTTTPTSVTPRWSPMRVDPVRWLRVHNFRAYVEDSRARRVA